MNVVSSWRGWGPCRCCRIERRAMTRMWTREWLDTYTTQGGLDSCHTIPPPRRSLSLSPSLSRSLSAREKEIRTECRISDMLLNMRPLLAHTRDNLLSSFVPSLDISRRCGTIRARRISVNSGSISLKKSSIDASASSLKFAHQSFPRIRAGKGLKKTRYWCEEREDSRASEENSKGIYRTVVTLNKFR